MRTSFPFALILAVLSVAATARLEAQEAEIPEGLKDRALTISIAAYVMQGGGDTVAWHSEGLRCTVPGTPVGVRLVGSNVVIVIQVTAYDDGKSNVDLVTQGQVWVKGEDGALSYKTTMYSVTVRYGERVYFFPLGRSDDGRSPIRVEIFAERYNPDSRPGQSDVDTGGANAAGPSQPSIPASSPPGRGAIPVAPPSPPPPSSTSPSAPIRP